MKNKIIFLLGICILSSRLAGATPSEEGKTIFMSRCAGCHNVNKILTGPALAGIDERRPIDWIINFVHSSQSVVKSGDAYAVALFEKFNKIPMPDHPDLTADHIKSIVDFIKQEAKPVVKDAPPFARPGKLQPNYIPLSLQKNYPVFIGYLGVVALLIAALLMAVRMTAYRNNQAPKQ